MAGAGLSYLAFLGWVSALGHKRARLLWAHQKNRLKTSYTNAFSRFLSS